MPLRTSRHSDLLVFCPHLRQSGSGLHNRSGWRRPVDGTPVSHIYERLVCWGRLWWGRWGLLQNDGWEIGASIAKGWISCGPLTYTNWINWSQNPSSIAILQDWRWGGNGGARGWGGNGGARVCGGNGGACGSAAREWYWCWGLSWSLWSASEWFWGVGWIPAGLWTPRGKSRATSRWSWSSNPLCC